MTTILRRHPAQMPVVLTAAGLACLACLALFGDSKPLTVVAAPLAVVGAWFAMQRPTVTLVFMIVVEVTNVSAVLRAYVSLPLFQASLALGVLALMLALRDAETRRRLNGGTVVAALLLGCYLVTVTLAVLGSTNVSTSLAELQRAVIDCVFLLVTLMLMQATGKMWTAAAAFVIPLAVMCFLTVVNQVAFGGTFSFAGFATVTEASGEAITTLRYGGPLPDSNFWGRHLVMGLPLAAALLVRSSRAGRPPVTIGWALATVALLAGIYLTQSRGTFLAALVAAVIWVLASGRTSRRWGMIALPVVVIGALVIPGVGDRLTAAVTELSNAKTSAATVDPSLLGRMASQEMAAMMFEQRPVFGYGPGTFAEHADEFAGLVPTAVRSSYPDRQPIEAPHNIYLGMAAESGAVSVAGWILMLCGFIAILLIRMVAEPRSPDRVLVAAVAAAIVAWSTASIMLHLAYFRTFGLVLMMAVALASRWPPPVLVLRAVARSSAVWLLSATLGVGAGWWVWSTHSTTVVTASQRLTLVPRGEVNGYYAWALDLRSRSEILPTFASLLNPPDAQLSADPVRGVLTLSTTQVDEANARAALTVAVAQSRGMLSEVVGEQQYSLLELDQVSTYRSKQIGAGISVIAAGIGLGAALGAGWVLSRLLAGRGSDKRAKVEVSV